MRSVNPGESQNSSTKRRKAAPRAQPRRRPMKLVFFLAAVGAGALAFGFRAPLGDAISGVAVDVTDAGLRAIGATVQDVTVSGRRNAHSHEILAALNVDRGVSMLDFDANRARARVLDVDWVEDATVSRLLPDTIHVSIVEREPFAVWHKSGRNYVIDSSGETISQASPRVMEQLPYLKGKGAPDAAAKLFAMLKVRPSIRARVTIAERMGERRWNLKLDDGINVMLPAMRVEAALDELIRVNDRTDLLQRKVKIVDLRIPDRLSVQTYEDAKRSARGDTNT